MKINPFLFLLLCLLISCKKEKNNSEKTETKIAAENVQIPDSLSQNSIFLHKNENGFFRVWVKSKEHRGKYFYSDTLNILSAEEYVYENNRFSKIKEIKLSENSWSYLDIDSSNMKTETVGGKEYFFISANTSFMGTAVPEQTVQFWMINMKNIDENYELLYSGYPSEINNCIKGNFVNNKKLHHNIPIYNALQKFVKNSRLLCQPSKKEEHPDYYKNYAEKWQKDNQQDSHFGAGNMGALDRITSTYYKEDLFKIAAGTPTKIENNNFAVISYFRGDILAYDKKKKLYFPVIVESCTGFCNKEIQLINTNTLQITYEDQSSYELDLDKIIFVK